MISSPNTEPSVSILEETTTGSLAWAVVSTVEVRTTVDKQAVSRGFSSRRIGVIL